MNRIKVEEFISKNRNLLFPNKFISEEEFKSKLIAAPESVDKVVSSVPLRSPMIVGLLALFWLDRFYLGDIVKGIIKVMTLGIFGIWWIADIATASKRCKAYNCKNIIDAISNPSVVTEMKKMDESIDKAVDMGKKMAPVAKELKKGFSDVRDTFNVK